MKNKLLHISLILLLSSVVFAGAFIQFFNAKSEGDDIRLEWRTGEETNLKMFVVERKTHNNGFAEIGNVTPKGSNSSYVFIDKNVYKSTELIFTYRLKIVENNNQYSYSNEISVSHRVSGVKRTWGSIKAMFR
ncbi:MAG: hypothetical protein NZM09_11265 [Ignavibacterium sp.]|nr:hypothetical protein [Ignavibacterium sp.]MCX7611590.1 hypothetical protein [Ignavibacterium sp.]MDW8376256.1 hypothetical protein [Ignavibacteriales bacterium]